MEGIKPGDVAVDGKKEGGNDKDGKKSRYGDRKSVAG